MRLLDPMRSGNPSAVWRAWNDTFVCWPSSSLSPYPSATNSSEAEPSRSWAILILRLWPGHNPQSSSSLSHNHPTRLLWSPTSLISSEIHQQCGTIGKYFRSGCQVRQCPKKISKKASLLLFKPSRPGRLGRRQTTTLCAWPLAYDTLAWVQTS